VGLALHGGWAVLVTAPMMNTNDTALKLSLRSLVRFGAAALLFAATGCASAAAPHAQNAWSGKSTALDFYSDSCDAGDAAACANAGKVLLDATRTVHDDGLAARFMTRACNANAYYCGDLGQMYLTGKGVARDQERGMSFVDRGCTAKNVAACGVVQASRQQQAQLEAEKAKAAEAAQQAAVAQAKDAAPTTTAKKQDIKKTAKKGKPAKHK
jgi:TPR repeat protein